MTRSPLAALAFLLTLTASSAAVACPACMGDGRGAQLLKYGSFLMLLPFLVVALVIYVVRQAPERRQPQR